MNEKYRMTVDFFKQKYGYEIDGMWMPRVTAVTALVSKTNFFVGRVNSASWQAGADWGTLIHSTIEQLLKGKEVEISSRIAPSIGVFRSWQKTNGLEIENPEKSIERRVFEKEHWYAGTIDLVARIGGKLGVIDFKTSVGIRDEYSLQTAAYLYAYNSSGEESGACQTRWILRIDQYAKCKGCYAKKREKQGGKETIAEGNPSCNHQWEEVKGEIEFKELTEHQHDMSAFLAAKELWEWYHKDWLRKITNYPRKLSQKILL